MNQLNLSPTLFRDKQSTLCTTLSRPKPTPNFFPVRHLFIILVAIPPSFQTRSSPNNSADVEKLATVPDHLDVFRMCVLTFVYTLLLEFFSQSAK